MQISNIYPCSTKAFLPWRCFVGWFLCLLAPLVLLRMSRAAQQTESTAGLIQSETHLVLVSVIVKDKHGKPVDDLSRGDFTLLDNNQVQRIALFDREGSGANATMFSGISGPLTFTNRPPAGAPPVTVFLFDELNTALTDQELAKQDFLRYLRELPAESRVSVFVLGDSLLLLHDFSQDMASLLEEVNRHPNRVNPEVTAATSPPPSANSLTGGVANTAQWETFMRESGRSYVDYTKIVRASRTAEALQTIAGHLQGIPGRKTLIWISGGFPIELGLRNGRSDIPQGNPNIRPAGAPSRGAGGGGSSGAGGSRAIAQNSGQTSLQGSSSSGTSTPQLPYTGMGFEDAVERAIRALNEADVGVYPVDARGITTAAPFQANRSSIGKTDRPTRVTSSPDFNYETLETLAEETGGLAFHHINDLSAAIRDAASDERVNYSLAFYPAAGSLDGAYHHLEVKVNRADAKLRYRPGYFAAPNAAVAPPLPEAITNPIALAGIGFSIHLDPIEGGYRASVTINPRDVTFEPKDGQWTGSLQFLIVVGKVEQLTTIPLNFSEAKYREIQGKGLLLGARVKAPPGTTGFSLGFRDMKSGRVGTLHVTL